MTIGSGSGSGRQISNFAFNESRSYGSNMGEYSLLSKILFKLPEEDYSRIYVAELNAQGNPQTSDMIDYAAVYLAMVDGQVENLNRQDLKDAFNERRISEHTGYNDGQMDYAEVNAIFGAGNVPQNLFNAIAGEDRLIDLQEYSAYVAATTYPPNVTAHLKKQGIVIGEGWDEIETTNDGNATTLEQGIFNYLANNVDSNQLHTAIMQSFEQQQAGQSSQQP